jgi:hypothetical protein
MDKDLINKLRGHLKSQKSKYHLVVMIPAGGSSRYNGEDHDIEYLIETTEKILGEEYIASPQMMFHTIADSLRVSPSGLVIPQGHGDINAISNLEEYFEGPLPNIPIFEAIKNTGEYCNQDGSLIDINNKQKKDALVQSAYESWLIDEIKPSPLDPSLF